MNLASNPASRSATAVLQPRHAVFGRGPNRLLWPCCQGQDEIAAQSLTVGEMQGLFLPFDAPESPA